ncbi:DNA-binding response regulator [Bacillus cereus]|uniref:response regulator n=1 Tax=Bacillus cereus group TaxID=86661 RepID=UPI0001A00BA5|nr:response regulator transcription factor [Bacillus cereus]EEK75647.1 Response regulator receiver [Bacillus cereus R309803]PGZ64615.1 DNA-binding response regulator [Bacillus cereus]
MVEKIRIVLADDEPFVRKGLCYIIGMQEDMEIIGECENGQGVISTTLETVPDMVIMDIQMPDISGIEATKNIMDKLPNTKVVLLTTFDVQQYVLDGIRAGAVGYILKDTETEEMLDGIRAMNRGAMIYNSTTANHAFAQFLKYDNVPEEDSTANEYAEALTKREIDVLQLLAYGKQNHEIAKILCVSEGTVKTHIHKILQKLEVTDRTQAAVMAIRQKIVK